MQGLVYKLAEQSATDPNEFVLSDETVDRYGDVITASGWDLANFQPRKNPIALFNHHSDEVIGRWESVRVEGKKLLGRLILADEGTSDTVNKVRKLWQQGILRAVSVGFRALDKEKLTKDADEFWGPFRYLKQELVECSLVAVPANPNALQVSRAFGDHFPKLPDEVSALVLGMHARVERTALPAPRAHAKFLPSGKTPMKLSERIAAAQTELNRLRDALTALVEKDDLGDDEQAQIEELNTRIPEAASAIERMQSTERALAIQVVQRDPDNGGGGAGDRQQVADPRRPFSAPKKKAPEPSDFLVRMGVINLLAHINHASKNEIARQAYGDETTLMVLRAVTNPADTQVPAWAAELVQVGVGEFIDKLMPLAIYPRIASRGPRFTFDRYGIIKFPARSNTPTVNGSFVGEGAPIPVRRAGLTSITLTPKKLGVISTFTREIAMHSIPSIETIIRQAMAEDTSVAVDTVLIDAAGADAIRPAGIRNGVVGLTPSANTNSSIAMVEDLQALIGAITAVNGGRDIVIMLNPQQALAIAFAQTTTGDFMFTGLDEAGRRLGVTFVSSTTIPPTMVIAIDASEFTSATGDTPEYDVSDQATIHEEDTNPLPIIGGTGSPPIAPAVPAIPTRSLWQTASLGVRMLLDMNWAMRRSGMVSWMTAVTWP